MEVPIVKRIRIRRSREEIAAIVSSFRSSGQSASAFAESEGIAVSSLRLWSSQAKRVHSPKRPVLLPVAIPAGLTAPIFYEVMLAGGRVLRFPRGTAAGELAAICDALERLGRSVNRADSRFLSMFLWIP
jgi:hypothetical protein